MQQSAHRCQVAAWCPPLRVGPERAANVVTVVDQQVHTYLFAQARAKGMHTQCINGSPVKTCDGSGHIANLMVNQEDFGRFAVFTKQLNVNVAPMGGRAVPDGSAQIRRKGCQARHPGQRQRAQGLQFLRLALRTKSGNVIHNRIFERVVVRQGCSSRQTQGLGRPVLGRTVVKPLLNHQLGRHCRNFEFCIACHFACNRPA